MPIALVLATALGATYTADFGITCGSNRYTVNVPLSDAVLIDEPEPGHFARYAVTGTFYFGTGGVDFYEMIVLNDTTTPYTTGLVDGLVFLDVAGGSVVLTGPTDSFDDTAVPYALHEALFMDSWAFGSDDALCGTVSYIENYVAYAVMDVQMMAAGAWAAANTGESGVMDTDALGIALYRGLDALTDAGCITQLYSDEAEPIGGQYGTTLTGYQYSGSPTDIPAMTLYRATHTFGGTLADGTTFGAPGLASTYKATRAYAERSDGGYLFAVLKRTRGKRGTWYGITGTCPAPVDPALALSSWYGEPL